MGTGKTKTSIVAAGTCSDKRILVVCPASLKTNWEREIRMVYPEDGIAVISGGTGDVPEIKAATWIIINYDILNKRLDLLLPLVKEGEIETVIFDEAHYVKDTKTLRTKAALGVCAPAKRVFCLTGTPVMNRPIELFPLLRMIKHKLAYDPEKAISTSRKEYGKRYCGAYFHTFGRTGRGFWDESGATRIPELRELTRDSILRRTKEEVLDLPPKMVSVVSCPLDPEQQREYDGAWDAYLAWVAEHPELKTDIGNVLSAQALIELGKLKQVCSRAKVARMAEDIRNAAEQGEKVIVFSQYSRTISNLAEALRAQKVGTVTLTGQDDQTARMIAVDGFQRSPDIKAFIGNIQAAGVGLTLTASTIVMFADMAWSPSIHQQAEDRAHRIGQAGTVNVYYYVADGTIEEDIIDILQAKQDTIGNLTGGETTIQAFMDRLRERGNYA